MPSIKLISNFISPTVLITATKCDLYTTCSLYMSVGFCRNKWVSLEFAMTEAVQSTRRKLLYIASSVNLWVKPISFQNFPFFAVCPSKYIRNWASDLERLRGCRVIEGNLQISWIQTPSPSNNTPVIPANFANYSFPDLREVTGYVLLAYVNGLQTLRHIFPNLTVIRGQDLIYNYALLVSEVTPSLAAFPGHNASSSNVLTLLFNCRCQTCKKLVFHHLQIYLAMARGCSITRIYAMLTLWTGRGL